MIRKLEVRNFKRFANATFEFDDRLVIVGPNNCGKTTLLQAIALWAEAWHHWNQDDGASGWLRGDGDAVVRTTENGYIKTVVDNIRSVAVTDFSDLWHNKDVQEPLVLGMHTTKWRVALELHFDTSATLAIQPADTVSVEQLRTCEGDPLAPVYIPSTLRIEDEESIFADDVLPIRLSSGRGASVLRNMLLRLSESTCIWDTLADNIRALFGYAVSRPSRGDPLRVYYRHSENDNRLEIACAGSGFLRVLLLYSCLLYSRSNVILVDEPDMHLHRLLQNEVYGRMDRSAGLLREKDAPGHMRHVQKERRQLIVSTHSDVLVDKAKVDQLRSVTNTGLVGIQDSRLIKNALRMVTNSEIHTALAIERVLYVEGDTDVPILRAWAKTIGHPMQHFLDIAFSVGVAEKEGQAFAQRHYPALRTIVPSLRGIELRDKNSKDISPDDLLKHTQQTPPRIYWQRYEIENYLFHPRSILRFVELRGGSEAKARAEEHIQQNWPPMVVKNPFAPSPFHDIKGKELVAKLMEHAGFRWKDRECVQIAEEMTADEIHPEICEMLTEMAKALGVTDI